MYGVTGGTVVRLSGRQRGGVPANDPQVEGLVATCAAHRQHGDLHWQLDDPRIDLRALREPSMDGGCRHQTRPKQEQRGGLEMTAGNDLRRHAAHEQRRDKDQRKAASHTDFVTVELFTIRKVSAKPARSQKAQESFQGGSKSHRLSWLLSGWMGANWRTLGGCGLNREPTALARRDSRATMFSFVRP